MIGWKRIAVLEARILGRINPVGTLALSVSRIIARPTMGDRTAAAVGRVAGGMMDDHAVINDAIARLGIEMDDLLKLEASIAKHGRSPAVAELTTDTMLDAMFVAGDPAYCRERLAEVSILQGRPP